MAPLSIRADVVPCHILESEGVAKLFERFFRRTSSFSSIPHKTILHHSNNFDIPTLLCRVMSERVLFFGVAFLEGGMNNWVA